MVGSPSDPAVDLPPLGAAAAALGVLRIALALAVTLALLPPMVLLRLSGGVRDRALAALWSRVLLWLLGLSLRREGVPIRSGFLAANHVSWIDPLVVGAAAPAFFVAKREVRSWPGIGPVCRLGRVEFAHRAPSAVREQVARLAGRLRLSHLLCVFPEGTSTDGLRILPFRSSLFASILAAERQRGDIWVQPTLIRYRPGASLPDSYYSWWGSKTFAGHLFEVASRSRRGCVTISFLAPLAVSGFSDRKALARAAEERVRACFRQGSQGQAGGLPSGA